MATMTNTIAAVSMAARDPAARKVEHTSKCKVMSNTQQVAVLELRMLQVNLDYYNPAYKSQWLHIIMHNVYSTIFILLVHILLPW